MCRFAAYLGKPILIDELLFKPDNSLVKQSIRARETDEPLNGDGFGLGWYAHEIDFTPGLFTSVMPAWNDRNLIYLSQKIRTNCLFAHVRAASMGGVSIFNCHPFHFKRILFMHNGSVGGFSKIKRYLRRELNDEVYDWVKGQTDSEHLFALFLTTFMANYGDHSIEGILSILQLTFARLFAIQQEFGVDEPNYLNLAITAGNSILAVRYSNDPKNCPTLYFSAGSRFEADDKVCHMHPPGPDGNEAVLIVSEMLTNYKAEWEEIPINSALVVSQELDLTITSLDF